MVICYSSLIGLRQQVSIRDINRIQNYVIKARIKKPFEIGDDERNDTNQCCQEYIVDFMLCMYYHKKQKQN